jgi:hypothetical protein
MEDIRKTYDFYMDKFNRQSIEIKRTKEMLNLLADDLGIQKPFTDIVDESIVGGKPKMREDQFVGKALATAVYEYLSLIGKDIGARPWVEIVTVLRDHGFEGLPKTKSAEENARMNILKSPKIKLVGENSFGLSEWYKKKRDKSKEDGVQEEEPKVKQKRGRPVKKKEVIEQKQESEEKKD